MKKKKFLLTLFIFISLKAEIDKQDLLKYLPNNPVILDAGAHNGRTTLELVQIFPESTVYAFEPVPVLFKQLQSNAKSCSNIKCYQLALGEKEGTAVFHVSQGRGDGSSSLLKPKDHLNQFPDVKFNRNIFVNVNTLDNWAQREGVDRIDFLWLDMQGAEYAMMKASPQIMSTVKAIYTEFSLTELYENCPLYPEYKKWLESLGFEEVYKELIHETFGDALFVRKTN